MSSYKFHLATDTSSCLGHNFLIAFKTTLDQGLGLPVLFLFCFRSQISLSAVYSDPKVFDLLDAPAAKVAVITQAFAHREVWFVLHSLNLQLEPLLL